MRNDLLKASLLMVAITGCGDVQREAFDSSDLASESISRNISQKNPVIIKLDDGNLMCITQIGYRNHFYKTSSGYSQAGGEINLKVVGGGITVPKANLYMEINYLEALAYVNYDFEKIMAAVSAQYEKDSGSVEPKWVDLTLRRLVTPGLTRDGDIDHAHRETHEAWWLDEGEEPVTQEFIDAQQFLIKVPPTTEAGVREMFEDDVPVYFRLPDGNLLKVCQTAYASMENNIDFYKTSEGYASAGARGHIAGYGGSGEVPVSNIYFKISAREVIALLDGNINELCERVNIQDKIIGQTVEPSVLEQALK